MTLTRPCGVMPSLRLVNPFMSQNSHRHEPALTFRRGQGRAVDQPFHDARIDILAKGLPDALVVAQLHDHPVECGRQLPDFVARRHVDGLIELASLDRARALPAIGVRSG